MKLGIAQKFYLVLVLPLSIVSVIVIFMTYNGLKSNAADLEFALRLQAKGNNILSLIQGQDQASMGLLIDPSQLELFSQRKIDAYDSHKKLLAELKAEAISDKMLEILSELSLLDEQILRPTDTKVLELLFEDPEAARALYFVEYEPSRVKYGEKIRELAAIGTSHVKAATAKTIQKNLYSLLQISVALLFGIGVVSTAISILARQIQQSKTNMKDLMGSLNDGLFFFDKTGKIPEERSQALQRILPGSEKVIDLRDFVAKFSSTPASNVDVCMDLLWNNDPSDFMSDFSSTVTFLPQTIHTDESKIVKIQYKGLNDNNGRLKQVVAVVSDVTEKLRVERDALMQAERVRKISKAAASKESYQSFISEAIGLFRRVDLAMTDSSVDPEKLNLLKRDLHTIKGSVATFDFSSLSHEVHQLESLIDEDAMISENVQRHWAQVKDQWKFESTDIDQVLGLSAEQNQIYIASSKFQELHRHALMSKDAALEGLLENCRRYPLQNVLAKYISYLDKIAEKELDKSVQMTFAADSSELSYQELQSLDSSLVHIFRNCFDHGIESKVERIALGKQAVGGIHCAVYRMKDNGLHFIIKDDGRGIDGDRLAAKAVKNGIWTQEQAAKASFQKKIELIFEANLSTRDVVSDLSGRGVGMDAVRSSLSDLGGKISIYSKFGHGTQFEIDVPGIRGVELLES